MPTEGRGAIGLTIDPFEVPTKDMTGALKFATSVRIGLDNLTWLKETFGHNTSGAIDYILTQVRTASGARQGSQRHTAPRREGEDNERPTPPPRAPPSPARGQGERRPPPPPSALVATPAIVSRVQPPSVPPLLYEGAEPEYERLRAMVREAQVLNPSTLVTELWLRGVLENGPFPNLSRLPIAQVGEALATMARTKYSPAPPKKKAEAKEESEEES